MKILALDTAGWECSAALWEDGHELSFQEMPSERDQAALLPQLVENVMGSHKVDQVLTNVGPGSFTGIRVGLAFGKGLALGLGIPLKGIDSFTALYQSIDCQGDILVLVESRRQDIFAQLYFQGIPQPPQSLERKDVEKLLEGPNPPIIAGRGAQAFLKGIPHKEATLRWRGAQILAFSFFKNPSLVSDALPFYSREADVTYSKNNANQALHP